MPDSPEVIVFGGAGFIGTHLLQSLVASGKYARVISVDIGEPRARVAGVDYIHHDVRTPIDRKIGGGPSTLIFNLAAVHVTPGHPEGDYYYTNVLGAANVCRFAQDIGCESIIFTSSISVYGPSENQLDEDSPPAPVSAYGRSKLSAEVVHQFWQSASPARRLTVVRPAVVYGLYERGMADRNQGILTYNFCCEQRTRINEICAAFCQVAGYRVPRLKTPIWFMNLAVMPFEMLQAIGIKTGINRDRIKKLWFSTNIFPKRLVASGFKFEYDLASSLADWKRTSSVKDFD